MTRERPNRHEELNLSFSLDADGYKQHRPRIKKLTGDCCRVDPGDTYNLSYSFYLDYFGRCAERLGAILDMAEDGVVIEASYEELQHGSSLLVDVGRLMGRLQQHVEGGSP